MHVMPQNHGNHFISVQLQPPTSAGQVVCLVNGTYHHTLWCVDTALRHDGSNRRSSSGCHSCMYTPHPQQPCVQPRTRESRRLSERDRTANGVQRALRVFRGDHSCAHVTEHLGLLDPPCSSTAATLPPAPYLPCAALLAHP
jgi:hypothetical protein